MTRNNSSHHKAVACLRLATHNVNKQVATRGDELLSYHADVVRGDVLALQETACDDASMQRAMQRTHGTYQWFLPQRASTDAPTQGGVALLVRSSLLRAGMQLGPLWHGPRGRMYDHRVVGLPITWAGHRLFVVNVYLPNQGQGAWLQHLMPSLQDACGSRHLVLLGDFNFVEDPQQDRVRRAGLGRARDTPTPGDVSGLAARLDSCPHLQDVYRHHSPRGRQMTHVYPGGASRLDRVYAHTSLLPHVRSCGAGPPHLSDHRAVVCVLAAKSPSGSGARGRGLPRCRLHFWRQGELRRQFLDWCQHQADAAPADGAALLEWWASTFKPLLVGEIWRLNRVGRGAAVQQPLLGPQQAAVGAAQARLDAGDASALPDLLAARRALLDALRASTRQPDWLHAREGPCPSLTAAVAPPAAAAGVAALRGPSGHLQPPGPAQSQLMIQHLAAVSGPFSPDAAAVEDVLAAVSQGGPRLGSPDAAALDAADVGEDEVLRALKRLPSGRSPGIDGLPLEAYRRAATQLVPLLARLFSSVGAAGRAPAGFLDGGVTSLFKPHAADPTDPACYRPITLLNTDYKLLTKLLANRLLGCLGTIIHPTQTGYLPGRHIGANVLTLQLVPHHLAASGQSCAVVFLDTRKAFDTVHRPFLLAVMEAMGVGPRFRAWVALLLGRTRACSVLNGHVSQFARFHSGVRQGCPLSPLLYLFVGEALLRFLSRNALYGLPLPGGGRLVAEQFADDTQVYLPHLGLETALLADLATFGRASNQCANVDKTKVLLVGAVPPAAAPAPGHTPGGMRLVSEVDALGFTFPSGVGDAAPAGGWDALLSSAERRLNRLGGQPLSMFGRALAASAYAASKVLQAAEFAAMPEGVLQRLEAALARYVQCGRTPNVTRRRRHDFYGVAWHLLPGHPSRGGLGLLPVRQHVLARHARWASQLLSGEGDHPWLLLARAALGAALPAVLGAWPTGMRLPPATLAALPPALSRMLQAAAAMPAPQLAPAPAQAGQQQPGVVAGWHLQHSRQFVPAHALGVKAATELLMTNSAPELERLGRLRKFLLVVQSLWSPGTLVTPEQRAAAWQLREQTWVSVPLEQRAAALQQLRPLHATLRALWKLPWSNDYKQLFWQLLYNALPTVARLHTPRAQPCPCGLPSLSPPPYGTPARPDWVHAVWECHVARAVVHELSDGCRSTVTPVQLLLMQPPKGVLAEVWRVVCLAALNAMWRFRASRGPRRRRRGNDSDSDSGSDGDSAFGCGGSDGAGDPPEPEGVAILRAGGAVECFWALLADFVRGGSYPRRWRRSLSPAHPFLCFPRPCGSLQLSRPGAFASSPAGAAAVRALRQQAGLPV